jgi:hypothetical protein
MPEADAAVIDLPNGAPPADAAAMMPEVAADQAPDLAPDLAAPQDTATPDAAADTIADMAPDLTPDKGPPGTALLVVGDVKLSKSDTQLQASLLRLGFTVAPISGKIATAADAAGKAAVIISGSSWSDDVGGEFTDVTVPVVVFDAADYYPMKMTGKQMGTDFDSADGTRLTVLASSHPLAAGLSGTVTVANSSLMLSWGLPSSSATRIATIVGQSNRFTIFGYEAGAMMVNYPAPARRVGFFVRYPGDATYTAAGLQLFEASVLWATEQLQ